MSRKKTRRLMAFLCAAILMSSQLAVAAYACPQIASPGAPTATEETNIASGCARAMSTQPTPLCKAHCDLSAQSSQASVIALVPSVWLNLWVVSRDTLDSPLSRVTHDGSAWLTDSSPPLRIQYQVFRI